MATHFILKMLPSLEKIAPGWNPNHVDQLHVLMDTQDGNSLKCFDQLNQFAFNIRIDLDICN